MAENEKDFIEEDFEKTVIEPDEEAAEEVEEEVAEEPSELETELAETKDRYLRVVAEYENYRKRTAREKDALYVDVTAGSVKTLLPIIDNIERALAAENVSVEDMRKGFEMILGSAGDCFEKLGVTSFGAVGDDFDANIHDCIGMSEDGDVESGKICMVLQKGYAMGQKIIRTAMVQVKA